MIGSETLEKIYPAEENELLTGLNTFDAESDEDVSSGDDEDLIDPRELLIDRDGPQHNNIDVEKKYATLMEPLFTPIGDESGMGNSINGSMGGGAGGVGKLPFNRRKIRYFDSITAQDTMIVRAYLNKEMQRSKQREVMLLSKHLKRAQRKQRIQLKEKRGEILNASDVNDLDSTPEKDQQRTVALSSVSRFEQNMTPALAAALVIESLQINKLESVEGMSKCYDGIIAAGIALLEININNDPTSSSSSDDSSPGGSGNHGKRSQIMGALTPLLISSLEQPSGDVIIALAKLRRMCGTARYQRRFIQRVAPALIRPPQGALWCLKHQNDMEPILAAAELILDSAIDIFSKGWYDRGQLLLADTKRAETLNTVAMQLKNLSSHPRDNLTLELGHGTNTWRSNKYKSGKDSSKGGAKEPLAEWEVIEVDRQIRVSISNIIAMDWSRVVVSKEAALSSASLHRSRAPSKRPSILLQTTSSGDMNMSPKNTLSPSPLSPIRQPNLKPQYALPSFGAETGDGSANPTSFFPPNPERERTRSPTPPGASSPNIPLSPPPPNREVDAQFAQASSNLFPPSEQTPPRSPTPKSKEAPLESSSTSLPISVPLLPLSPKRTNKNPNASVVVKESIATISDNSSSSSSPVHPQFGGERDRAPLSPPPVGVGTVSDGVPHHRPISSTSSVSSAITAMSGMSGSGSQPSHYRMLTSTAAERKRTVAACRALRAQITRFEEAFIQLHGRSPKGAAERAPLATTYAQYREWKRAIRADAACRIQALIRGASTRWMLLRSNNPQISRVVATKAGRRGFVARSDSTQGQSVLDELSIPAEIGDDRQQGILSSSGRGASGLDIQVQGTGQSIVPQWGGEIVRRRPGSNEFSSNSPIPRPVASPIVSSNSRTSGDLTRLSLPELQARKRELKQQLKQYDMSFARRHGRMPVKAEKEPIRHLYERYNALKGHIGEMEQEGRRSSSPTPIPVSSSTSPVVSTRVNSVSPVGSDSDESTGRRSSNASRRISSSASSNPTGSSPPTQDLATLKAEKSRLHQMLRSFERDFFRENQRQVQSFADIRPVASQYRRYKEIKRAIAALQRGER